jgi:hypothetical protein
VGLLLGPVADVVAVDLDIDDLVVAHEIKGLASEFLGETPAIRIGRVPREVRLYRGSEIKSTKAHPVEVFGSSGQVVAFGRHPSTGESYDWPDESPLSLKPTDLPPVVEGDVDRFLLEANKLLGVGQRLVAGTLKPARTARCTATGSYSRLAAQRAKGRAAGNWPKILASQLRSAEPGELHNVMVSGTAAMVRRGFSDEVILRFFEEHFAAPRHGEYAEVWDQIPDAVESARVKFDVPFPTTMRIEHPGEAVA